MSHSKYELILRKRRTIAPHASPTPLAQPLTPLTAPPTAQRVVALDWLFAALVRDAPQQSAADFPVHPTSAAKAMPDSDTRLAKCLTLPLEAQWGSDLAHWLP